MRLVYAKRQCYIRNDRYIRCLRLRYVSINPIFAVKENWYR